MLTKRSFARLLKGVLGEKLYADLRRRSLAFRSNRRAFTEIYERQLWGAAKVSPVWVRRWRVPGPLAMPCLSCSMISARSR